jgi:hypothetical protein
VGEARRKVGRDGELSDGDSRPREQAIGRRVEQAIATRAHEVSPDQGSTPRGMRSTCWLCARRSILRVVGANLGPPILEPDRPEPSGAGEPLFQLEQGQDQADRSGAGRRCERARAAPAARTFRCCCEIAGGLTLKRLAISPAANSPSAIDDFPARGVCKCRKTEDATI